MIDAHSGGGRNRSNNNDGGNIGDAWYSTDGRNWYPSTDDPIAWDPRHAASLWVYQDSLYLAGGGDERIAQVRRVQRQVGDGDAGRGVERAAGHEGEQPRLGHGGARRARSIRDRACRPEGRPRVHNGCLPAGRDVSGRPDAQPAAGGRSAAASM